MDEKVDDIVDKSILRPTKVERRQKLKKSKREAKKLAKVETNVDDEEKNMHAEVLVFWFTTEKFIFRSFSHIRETDLKQQTNLFSLLFFKGLAT